MPLWRVGDGGQGAGLGHAPGLDHADAVLFFQGFHQASGHRGASADHHAQAGEIDFVGFREAEDFIPDCGDSAREGRFFLRDESGQGFGLQEFFGQDDVRARHPGGVREPPGIGVEHGNDHEHAIILQESEGRG